MRTYISPIGYDTRRVTRPVIDRGLSEDDKVILVRPTEESDTERAEQAVADVRQFLQEIEPACTISVEHVVTGSLNNTVRDCCQILSGVGADRETVVLLSGGARDILLPLTVSSLVYEYKIDSTVFFSDLDNSLQEWALPDLTVTIPEKTMQTFQSILEGDDWISLSEIVSATDQSKSTVIRHVNELEDAGVVESDRAGKVKRVRITFTGELFLQSSEH